MLLITFFFTRERNNQEIEKDVGQTFADTEKKKKAQKLSVGKSFAYLFKNKHFLLLTLIFVVNYTALGVKKRAE